MADPRNDSLLGPRRGDESTRNESHHSKHTIKQSGQQHKGMASQKQNQEPERYQDDVRGKHGGMNAEPWYLDRKKKEQFLMFTRVLIKYLKTKDYEMHQRAERVLKMCSERNEAGDPEYSSLTNSMRINLRRTVGEQYWRKAEAYTKTFLQAKGESYWDESEQEQNKLGARTPAPVTLAASMTSATATTTKKRKKTKKIDLDEVPFDQLEQAFVRRKRENTLAVLRSVPFEMLEEVFHERKRLKSTVDLTSGDVEGQNPDDTGVALRIQAEQQQALVKIKVEKEDQAAEISNLQGKIKEGKKVATANLLSLERVKECVICQEADKCVALYPCTHLALCHGCQNLVDECPICREKIEERKMVKLV